MSGSTGETASLSASMMARKLVLTTLLLWSLLALFAGSIARQPGLALLPFYGLYPGGISSGEPDYHPQVMQWWGVGTGAVFLTLAVVAVAKDSKPAAGALLGLFLLSSVISIARFLNAMSGLH